MSNAVTNACRPFITTPTQKAVLMCLADRADDQGCAWRPSLQSLMTWTCFGRTAVIDALKLLEHAGVICVERESGKANKITVNVDVVAAAANPSAKRTSPPTEPVRLADGFEEPAPKPLPAKTEKARASSRRASSKSVLTELPDDFAISTAVRAWAAEHGHEQRLDEYFEAFVGKSKAKGYTNKNWDQAFMNSIRDDWSGIRKRRADRQPAAPVAGRHSGFEKMDYLEGVGSDGRLL